MTEKLLTGTNHQSEGFHLREVGFLGGLIWC